MTRRYCLLVVWSLASWAEDVAVGPARAQSGAQPLAAVRELLPKGLNTPVAGDGRFVLVPLREEDRRAAEQKSDLPAVGLTRPLPPEAVRAGRCETLPDGNTAWRLELHSPNAAGLRLRFEDFDTAEGQLWVYSGQDIHGPYGGRGPLNTGQFWSPTIFADRVVIEYDLPAGTRCREEPPFRVTAVAHFWDEGLAPRTKIAAPQADLNCHYDVSCYPDYAEEASGVAQFRFEKSGSWYVCTGVLLNTKPFSGTPYFLTANHCVSDQAQAQTMEVFWFYQTAYCNGAAPNKYTLPRSYGQAFLVGRPIEQGDYSLVRLNTVDHVGNVWFQGWTTYEPPFGGQVVGIHHPSGSNNWYGDHKRISFGNRVPDQSANYETGQTLPADLSFRINWYAGTTEGGSSGSPLFVLDPLLNQWVVGGVLSGGTKGGGCSSADAFSWYGRFSQAYPVLRPYINLESCSFVWSPASVSVSYVGGTLYADLSVAGGCSWSASSDVSWIRLAPGPSSGTGSVRIYFTVDPNPGSSVRVGHITAGGQTLSVTQHGAPACQATRIAIGQTVSGNLTPSCTSSYRGAGYYVVRYVFSASAGQRIWISMNSSVFDSYLTLMNPSGIVLYTDDDGGAGTNSRIPPGSGTITLNVAGDYVIEASSYLQYVTGPFTLAVGSTPSNDEPGGATVIAGLPQTFSLDTTAATESGSDPVHSCTGMRDSNTVWFRWTANFTGRLRADSFGSGYDTVLAAYSGEGGPGVEVACNDDFGGSLQSRIEFAVVFGRTYWIQVSEYGAPGGGSLVLNVRGLAPGDYSRDGRQDLLWRNDSTRQLTVHYFQGTSFSGWSWLYNSGIAGWRAVVSSDFDGNGTPDLVWQNDATRQVTVHYFDGSSFTGWSWLNSSSNPGWWVVAAADVNGDGRPDLIWQHESSRAVTVHYYGGAQGNQFTGWAWLSSGFGGWRVVAAADFNGDGRADLVWQNDSTRQVTVHYYSGSNWLGWNWLNAAAQSGWVVVGAGDFNGDGKPDLVWQHDSMRQVTVHFYSGASGNQFTGWAWLNVSGNPGWRVIVPR